MLRWSNAGFFFLNYYLSLYYVVKHKRLCGYRIISAHQRSCGKVMFSLMSVCLSVHRRQGLHVTITHDVLDIIVQPSPHPLGIRPWPLKPQPPPASDIWWSSLKTCSNLFIWGHPQNNIWWWSHVWFTNGWYISYWNAFLCSSKDLIGNLFGWSVVKIHIPLILNYILLILHLNLKPVIVWGTIKRFGKGFLDP